MGGTRITWSHKVNDLNGDALEVGEEVSERDLKWKMHRCPDCSRDGGEGGEG